MKKRLISLLTTAAMTLSLITALPHSAIAANAADDPPIALGEYVQLGTYNGEDILWRCVAFEKATRQADGSILIDSTETSQIYQAVDAAEGSVGYLPLMISDRIITLKAFDAAGSGCSHENHSERTSKGSQFWGDSNLRDWLNGEYKAGRATWSCGNAPTAANCEDYNGYDQETGFLNDTNFNAQAKKAIQEVTQRTYLSQWDDTTCDGGSKILNSDSYNYTADISTTGTGWATEYYSEYYYNVYSDKMFCLDVQQLDNMHINAVNKGWTWESADTINGKNYYYGNPTAAAVTQSADTGNGAYTTSGLAAGKPWYYWLRSPYYSPSYRVRCVGQTGQIDTLNYACSGNCGVRPAFFLDAEYLLNNSDIWISGDGTADNPYRINDGIENNPYEIPDLETLEAFRDKVNGGESYAGKCFKLTADIDMSGTYNADTSTSWTPIGNDSNPFTGTFDGGGHTISGLYINSTADYQGLFGYLKNGFIKDLSITGSVTGGDYVGGICGYANFIEGALSWQLDNCENLASVTGTDKVGGICGYMEFYDQTEESPGYVMTKCRNSGNITGSNSVGGVYGYASGGLIYECANSGDVVGTYNVGGLGGTVSGMARNGDFSYLTLKNSCNTGSVSGSEVVGGVCGHVDTESTVVNCYNTGTVSGTRCVGSVCGDRQGEIKNCYYLIGTAASGINGEDTIGTAEVKTAEEFASGEVAYLLQNGQDTQDTLVWGQTVGSGYPELTSDSAKKVYKVTFNVTDSTSESGYKEHAAAYANYNGTVALPTAPTAADGFTFYKWSQTNSADGAEFTASTKITADTTVCAVQREQYGEESGEHKVETTYGTAKTLDLSTCVGYGGDTAEAGKFDYAIQSGNDTLAATISGDTLTVPATTPAGSYTLTIRATEKEPQVTLMAANSLGTEPVDFTVTVTVTKATLTPVVSVENKTYDGTSDAKGSVTLTGSVNDETPTATASFAFANADAGVKTVTASITLMGDWDKNYQLSTTTVATTATIYKKTLTPSVTVDDKTYDGTTTASGTVTFTGAVNTEDPTATATFAFDTADAGKNKTVTASITLTGDWGENYQLSTTTVATVASIMPKDIIGAEITLGADLAYTGTEQTQTITSVVVDSLTVTYTVSGNTGTDVGNYTLTVTGTGNFTGTATKSWTIAQAPNTVSNLSCANIIYGDTPSPSADATFGTPTFTYSQQENGTYAGWNTANGAGVWYVKAAVVGTKNYAGAEATASFTVGKATLTANDFDFAAPANLIYDGAAKAATVTAANGVTGIGTVTVKYYDANGAETTPIDVGTYIVKVDVTEGGNYAAVTNLTKASWTFTIVKAQEATPSADIDYTAEKLTGLTAAAEYTITPENGAAYSATADSEGGVAIQESWMGQAVSLVKTATNGDYSDSAVQNLTIPTRPDAPGAAMQVTKTVSSVAVTNTADFSGCEFSINNQDWIDAGNFTDLDAGTEYTLSVRVKATTDSFASAAGTRQVTTVNADGSTVVLPGESAVLDDGTTVANDGEKVTITSGETITTITPAGEETVVHGDGTVEVPDGAMVRTGSGPEITVGPGNGGTVDPSGKVTPTSGGSVTITGGDGSTTKITLPDGKGVAPTADGTVSVPPGSTVQIGEGPLMTLPDGGTVSEDGKITVPGGGTVQVDTDPVTTITVPEGGGIISVGKDGNITVPGGSTVKIGSNDPVAIPESGGTITSGGEINYNVTVAFDSQGGSTVASQSVTVGGKVDRPADPTRSGYTFGGWYKEADCATAWDFENDAVTADTTLYAKWTQNSSPSSGSTSSGSSSRKPSVSSGEGGNVTASRDGSVAITPDEGYQIAKITVNGKEVEIPADGKLIGLKRTDKVVVTFEPIPAPTTPASERFTDVKAGAWYEDAITYVVEKGLFNGTSDTTFSPTATMTRGMLATVLYRAEGEPGALETIFDDVASGRWYSDGIAWAAEKGIVAGYGNGLFGPEDNITREQLAVMLWRYAGEPETAGKLESFNDAGQVSSYANTALRWAVEQGIVTGKGGGTLDPQGQATRSEVATMLMRYFTMAG